MPRGRERERESGFHYLSKIIILALGFGGICCFLGVLGWGGVGGLDLDFKHKMNTLKPRDEANPPLAACVKQTCDKPPAFLFIS